MKECMPHGRMPPMELRLATCTLSPHRTLFTSRDQSSGILTSNRKKVVIMGAGTDSYPLAEYEEQTWELWCCNALWRLGFDADKRFRADRWFEMHPRFAQSEQDLARLIVAPVDVYTLQATDASWVLNWIRYPLERINSMGFRPSFASTFAYQIALAISLKMHTIRLVGIYMIEGREALIERANLLYWIGVAEGLGIEVQIVDSHENLATHPHLYGYDYNIDKESAEEYCREVLDSIARDGWRGTR
jgi:hypothetical protein